jgi:ketosteroid isomerase-like protein
MSPTMKDEKNAEPSTSIAQHSREKQRATARGVVQRIYDLEVAQDLDAWSSLWAETAVVEFPLARNPLAERIEGKEALVELTATKFRDRSNVSLDVQLDSLADPSKVVASVRVRFTDEPSGSVVDAPILCIFTLNEDGQVARLEEFFNEAFVS